MPELLVTEADNGNTLDARIGDVIVLRLAENPTTGFRWHVERLDAPVERVSDRNITGPEVRIGAGAPREFRLLATAPGTGRIELKHLQLWVGDSSIDRRFAVRINVSE